jgi:hypothetical protein
MQAKDGRTAKQVDKFDERLAVSLVRFEFRHGTPRILCGMKLDPIDFHYWGGGGRQVHCVILS